jgi:hypothetical protein
MRWHRSSHRFNLGADICNFDNHFTLVYSADVEPVIEFVVIFILESNVQQPHGAIWRKYV